MSIFDQFPDVAEVQAKVDETLCTSIRDLKGERKSVFDSIMPVDDATLSLGLGRLGMSLKVFASKVDYHHPTVEQLNDYSFSEGSHFYNQITETIALAHCAKEKGLKVMPEEIATWLNLRYEKIVKVLLKPPVSILKTEKAREEARNVAKAREIDLTDHYLRAGIWEAVWPSAKPYVRLGEGFKERVTYHKKVIERLVAINATTSAEFLKKQNEALQTASSDNYCGFVRLLMTDAALSLAKIMNFQWSTDLGRIVVPRESLSVPVSDDQWFLYYPRTYPLSKYPAPISDRMKDIIRKLETHPDSGGRPLFDLYWVVVPGIGIKGSHPSYYDGKSRKTFESTAEMYHSLDGLLIQNRDIVPILLGENTIEHKCYFISYMV